MELFDTLGFEWNRDLVPRDIPRASLKRVVFRFRRMLPEYVWDASVLEGNPFTFVEVKTLLDGVSVGGRNLSDCKQVVNLGQSARWLLDLVERGRFSLDKSTFCLLQELVSRRAALEWNEWRSKLFEDGIAALQREVPNPFERALAFFIFGTLQGFFVDGNMSTSRLVMNGVLMSEGIDAISIPAVRAGAFNTRMVDFYRTRNATDMMAFVAECHPDIVEIHRRNPHMSEVRGLPNIKYHSLQEPRGP